VLELCEAATILFDSEIEDEIVHECGLDKGHEEAHKCFCGEEF